MNLGAYFTGRMISFVVLSCFADVFLPSFFANRIALDWWALPLITTIIASSIIYIFLFAITELFVLRRFKFSLLNSAISRDLSTIMIYLLFSAALLFSPRIGDFSFGDRNGLIVDRGWLTSYGFQVQLNKFFECTIVAALFLVAGRILNIKSKNK